VYDAEFVADTVSVNNRPAASWLYTVAPASGEPHDAPGANTPVVDQHN
jgi:hypothetical protein